MQLNSLFTMKFKLNDGGRLASGRQLSEHDCVVRAIAISLNRPYQSIHLEVSQFEPTLETEGVNTHASQFLIYMAALGFHWVPALGELYIDDLPCGQLIADAPKHYTAVHFGTIEDTIDCRGNLCRGYWAYNPAGQFDVFKEGVKINRHPMNKAQALTMRRLYQTNYGHKIFVL